SDSVVPKRNRSSPISPLEQVESNRVLHDDNSGGFKRLKIEEDGAEDSSQGPDSGSKGAFRPWKPDNHVAAQNGMSLAGGTPENEVSELDETSQNHLDIPTPASPSVFLNDIKNTLSEESTISHSNKDAVLNALERLVTRLRDAENSANLAEVELKKLKRSYKCLEDELDKKRSELRELLLLSTKFQNSSKGNLESTPNSHLGHHNNNNNANNSSNNNTTTSTTTSTTTTNESLSCGREDHSPLNLSAESGIDNQERTSSVDSLISKDPEDLRERMHSMERELRSLRTELAARSFNPNEDKLDGVDSPQNDNASSLAPPPNKKAKLTENGIPDRPLSSGSRSETEAEIDTDKL
ncbi:hypothetical protein TCAL_16013, partial [Tigriopus californicus]